jgi:hypothetical protein
MFEYQNQRRDAKRLDATLLTTPLQKGVFICSLCGWWIFLSAFYAGQIGLGVFQIAVSFPFLLPNWVCYGAGTACSDNTNYWYL